MYYLPFPTFTSGYKHNYEYETNMVGTFCVLNDVLRDSKSFSRPQNQWRQTLDKKYIDLLISGCWWGVVEEESFYFVNNKEIGNVN